MSSRLPGTRPGKQSVASVLHFRAGTGGGVLRASVVAGIGGFAAFAALAHTAAGQALDRAILTRIQANRDPRLERMMRAVSWLGYPPQSRLLPLAYAVLLWFARLRLEAVLQLASAGTGLVSTVAKTVTRRQRPVATWDIRVAKAELGGSSLPSGHVLTYVGVYGWLAILANAFIRPRRLRRLAVGALTTIIAAIGPSRVYLGHHWPSDVLASYLLGGSYLAVLRSVYRRLRPVQHSRMNR